MKQHILLSLELDIGDDSPLTLGELQDHTLLGGLIEDALRGQSIRVLCNPDWCSVCWNRLNCLTYPPTSN
jgi:hypothetical protein